jgi:hypothetical protein
VRNKKPELTMTFENRRLFKRQYFQLEMSTLKVEIRNLFDQVEYQISLEHIDYKRRVEVIFNHGLFVASLFALVIGLLLEFAPNEEAALVFFLVAAVCFTAAFLLKKRVVTINSLDGNKIELYFNNRNKHLVVSYADQIVAASNAFLLHKYGKVDPALPIEPQINSIQFLRDREIISEAEYEGLKNQLLGKTNKTTIGFGY